MIQVECNSFNDVRVNFTSMSSSLVPASNCSLLLLECHPVNFCLKNDVATCLQGDLRVEIYASYWPELAPGRYHFLLQDPKSVVSSAL